jgi:P4 family phage/plasmid primase-like protien
MTNVGLALLFSALKPDGPISHNHQIKPTDIFHGSVTDPSNLDQLTEVHMRASQWMSIATLDVNLLNSTGRGTKKAIRRLMALPCDFDVKAGMFNTKNDIDICIDSIITNLGFQPVATVDTGHGLQPWWPLCDTDPAWRCTNDADPRWSAINAILKRWARYARWECETHGAGMDGVFDASRVMRIPDTLNWKDDTPAAVLIHRQFDDWEPITYDRLDEALTSLGFPQLPEDLDTIGEQIFDFEGMKQPDVTCPYARGVITGIASETPGTSGRHPWLTGKATRLWALYRYGCVTRPDIDTAMHTLRTRFLQICADPTIGGGSREEGPNEVKDAIRDMRAKVATWTDHKVAAEFTTAAGITHTHQPTPTTAAIGSIEHNALEATLNGTATASTIAVYTQQATLEMSEDGHALDLVNRFGDRVRYCDERGRWLWWDGWSWQWQTSKGGIVREFAKAIARAYPDQKEWVTHKRRSLSSAGTTACLTQASTDFRISISTNDLDAHPWELNTPGGIIDLRTATLNPPNPARFHTKITKATPDFDANQQPWLEFLHTTFQGDDTMIGYIQRLMGYACVGQVREAILPVFYGQGANGKTVLLETVAKLLGDYATVAPQGFLVQGPNQHATEIAALAGARLVIASETNEGEKFDEAKVKILTGGDSIKARFMRQDEFTFTPSHLLVLMTNHRPKVGSGGVSFWRRMRAIPFLNEIAKKDWDLDLQHRFVTEHGPAIMAWLTQGAAEYAAAGLREPEKVRVATETYEASTDTVKRFLDERCLIGGGDHVKIETAKVRSAYEQWCAIDEDAPVSAKAFTTQLTTRFNVGKGRDNKSRHYTNLSLLSEDDTDD